MTLSQVITAVLLVLAALTARWLLGSGPLTITRILVFAGLACAALGLLVTVYTRRAMRAQHTSDSERV